MHFQAHKSFYAFVGLAAVAAGFVFLVVSGAYTGGAIPSPDGARLALQFAIMAGIALVIGIVGLAMMFKWATGFILGLIFFGNGVSTFVFYNDPYNPVVAMTGAVSMSVGIIAMIFHLFFYRFIHWRLSIEPGTLTAYGASQALGFYGLLTAIFVALGLLGYFVLLDAPPFPL